MKVSHDNYSSASSRANRGRGRGRRGIGNSDHRNHQENQFHDSQGRGRGRGQYNSRPRDKSNVECYRCHRHGHYKSECRTNLSKNNGENSNFAEKEAEISLLMACYVGEEANTNLWYLDTGCSNHMCGDKSAFSTLDESFRDNVKFGDNSKVSVMGKGQVTIQAKGNIT